MSSVKKAVKKVFRGIKKVVKKIWKPVVAVGLGLMTAGLATGGFAAFSGVSSVSGFMGAVGKTMAAGGSSVMGALGLGGGAAAGGGSGGGGFLGGIGKLFSGIAGSEQGKMLIAQGIMGGIQSYAAGRERRRQEERQDSAAVWGVRRRGSEGEGLLQQPTAGPAEGEPEQFPTPSTWQQQDRQTAMQGPQQPQGQPQGNWGMPQPTQPIQPAQVPIQGHQPLLAAQQRGYYNQWPVYG